MPGHKGLSLCSLTGTTPDKKDVHTFHSKIELLLGACRPNRQSRAWVILYYACPYLAGFCTNSASEFQCPTIRPLVADQRLLRLSICSSSGIILISESTISLASKMRPGKRLLISHLLLTVLAFIGVSSALVPPHEWLGSGMVTKAWFMVNHKIQTIKDFNSFCDSYDLGMQSTHCSLKECHS